jgi:hypothetical protein
VAAGARASVAEAKARLSRIRWCPRRVGTRGNPRCRTTSTVRQVFGSGLLSQRFGRKCPTRCRPLARQRVAKAARQLIHRRLRRCGVNDKRAWVAVMRHGCLRGRNLCREHRTAVGIHGLPTSGLSRARNGGSERSEPHVRHRAAKCSVLATGESRRSGRTTRAEQDSGGVVAPVRWAATSVVVREWTVAIGRLRSVVR